MVKAVMGVWHHGNIPTKFKLIGILVLACGPSMFGSGSVCATCGMAAVSQILFLLVAAKGASDEEFDIACLQASILVIEHILQVSTCVPLCVLGRPLVSRSLRAGMAPSNVA